MKKKILDETKVTVQTITEEKAPDTFGIRLDQEQDIAIVYNGNIMEATEKSVTKFRFIIENENGFGVILPISIEEYGLSIHVPKLAKILKEDEEYTGHLEIVVDQKLHELLRKPISFIVNQSQEKSEKETAPPTEDILDLFEEADFTPDLSPNHNLINEVPEQRQAPQHIRQRGPMSPIQRRPQSPTKPQTKITDPKKRIKLV